MKLFAMMGLFALLVSPAVAEKKKEKKEPAPVPLVMLPSPLSDMMMDVQRLQARMAKGDKQAYIECQARMKAIGIAIATSSPDNFKNKREREAVVTYLLSGGQPRYATRLVLRGDFPEKERDLLLGALAYTMGRKVEAERLFHYDPKAQSLLLGAQLAYAQSVLLTPTNSAKSINLLDLVRILAPGTLVEEAALRREVLLVANAHETEKFALLSRQYLERYATSLYSGDFMRALTTTVVRFKLCQTLEDYKKFSSLLHLVTADQARDFLLSISRESLLSSHFDVAAATADAVQNQEGKDTEYAAQAHLYGALARFTKLPEAEMPKTFAQVSVDKLSYKDRQLLIAGKLIAAHFKDVPPREDYDETWHESVVAEARSPNVAQKDYGVTSTIRRAVAALESANALAVEGN